MRAHRIYGTCIQSLARVAAQQAHATDRFAREILAILECDFSRSRRLMRNPLGRNPSCPSQGNLSPIILRYHKAYIWDGNPTGCIG
jgi:hypothetical protein